MTEASTNDRRSSRRRRSTAPKTWRDRLRAPAVTRTLHAVVAVAGVLYLAGGVFWFRDATVGVGPLIKGMTEADVRYVQGPPTMQRRDPGGAVLWEWREPERLLHARFDGASGRLTEASCTDIAARGGSCPERLGLGVGTTEDAVWTVFGQPTRQAFANGDKTISYDDIGIEFGLRRFAIYRSAIIPRRGSGWFGRVLRVLVP